MQIGKWNKLPHYSIVGQPSDFYIWIDKDGRGGNTKWIKGKEAFGIWNRLKKLHKKDKSGFIELAEKVYDKYKK